MIDGLCVVIFSCLDDWKQEAQQWRLRWVSKHHRWETNFGCILGRLTFLKTTLVDLKQKPPPQRTVCETALNVDESSEGQDALITGRR